MLLDGEQWQAFFDSFEREAFRLETLPEYRVPQEAETLRRFLEGRPLSTSDTQAWTDRLKSLAAQGKTVARVHVVTHPLTDYLRFEFEHYRHNVQAGEMVRILDLTGRPNPGLPNQDFWMFDEARVVLMNYRPDGSQINRELIDADPAQFVRWKQIAIVESVPFLEYSFA